LVILAELAFQAVIFFKLRVLSFDVAIFTDSVVAGGAGTHGHADLDLEGAVTADTATARPAMVAEGEHTKALVAQHAIILVLLLSLLGDHVSGRGGHLLRLIIKIRSHPVLLGICG
jgi:hypothetical protein